MTQTIATATVETLVAEVRVLMVGSRQVTLSVARQLDYAKLEDIDPFGRVHLGGEGNHIIGRHRTSGALVLAQYQRDPGTTVPIDEHTLASKFLVCSKYKPSISEWGVELGFEGRRLSVDHRAVDWCGNERHTRFGEEHCAGWDSNDQDEVIRAQIAKWDRRRQYHLSMPSLPLIVLAGLR